MPKEIIKLIAGLSHHCLRSVQQLRLRCSVVLILSLNAGAVWCDSPTPQVDYKLTTKDGQFDFVMLTNPAHTYSELSQQYKQSGLYPASGAKEPLWTVDWYAQKVLLSADGSTLIKFGPWARTTADLAIAFYRNGKLLHEYTISDLITDESSLDYTVSHFFWRQDFAWDFPANRFCLATLAKVSYSFNDQTGLLVDIGKYSERHYKAIKSRTNK